VFTQSLEVSFRLSYFLNLKLSGLKSLKRQKISQVLCTRAKLCSLAPCYHQSVVQLSIVKTVILLAMMIPPAINHIYIRFGPDQKVG